MAGLLDSALVKKFRSLSLKAAESFILDSLDRLKDNWYDVEFLLFEMHRMGYNDEPDFDKEGRPILLRTTPLHLMARGDLLDFAIIQSIAAREFFCIYNKFELNYVDEFGLTHFHVACMYGCEDVVQKFLDLGQNPNLLVQKIDDSPLLLALNWNHKEVAELLLRRGADPNLPNKNGLTPLHVTCQIMDGGELAEFFFEINDKLNQLVRVNAPDKFGNTPLHFAVHYGQREINLLMRRGASLTLVNAEGSTPLHIICHRYHYDHLAKLVFKINEELNQPVQVDAVDNYGRTPLQLAVANILPNSVDVLLNNGADLSRFVFPDSYFGKALDPQGYAFGVNFELRVASGALLIVERLESSGYDLDRSDALIIMKLFAKHGLFEKSADFEKRLSENKFSIQAKEIMVKPNLSLCDLIRLPFKEVKKRITSKEYFDFSTFGIPRLEHRKDCFVHLCEKLLRRFFQSWALDLFMELTRYRLPILCCDMVIEQLRNEDLFHICLAATGQSS